MCKLLILFCRQSDFLNNPNKPRVRPNSTESRVAIQINQPTVRLQLQSLYARLLSLPAPEGRPLVIVLDGLDEVLETLGKSPAQRYSRRLLRTRSRSASSGSASANSMHAPATGGNS
jgi:hypothetical protein